jgi:hypothetical protein
MLFSFLVCLNCQFANFLRLTLKSIFGDPDPEPDPHVFRPPGSGSSGDRNPLSDVRIRILPFSHKCVERTEIL